MNKPEFPFRVFARVPAPGISEKDMFIPQYFEGGGWRAWNNNTATKQVAFATELEAQLYLIDFVEKTMDQHTRRINLLTTERDSLRDNLIDLKRQTIRITARSSN